MGIAYWEAAQPYFLPALVAFVLTVAFVRLALQFFPKWGLMDRPHLYGHRRPPIPYSGGLVIFLVFVIGALMFLDWDKHVAGLLVASFMIVAVSFLDDRYRLPPLLRLGVQCLAGLVVIASGIGITTVTNPLGGLLHLDAWQIPFSIGETTYHFNVLADLFTLIWIVLLMNTVNWLDGLPGQVSGISALAFGILFVLSIRPNFHYIDQTQVAVLAVLLAASSLAFWWFDFYPPKILMGDSGSMFLGFMLAILAIFSGGKIATTLLVMGFPILDALWVIGRRLWRGQSPFKGDLSHFHHRLLKMGLNERQTIFTIYGLCGLFGGVALGLGSSQKLLAIGVMLLVMVCLAFIVVLREKQPLDRG